MIAARFVLNALLGIAFLGVIATPALLVAAILSIPSWADVAKFFLLACLSLGIAGVVNSVRRDVTERAKKWGVL